LAIEKKCAQVAPLDRGLKNASCALPCPECQSKLYYERDGHLLEARKARRASSLRMALLGLLLRCLPRPRLPRTPIRNLEASSDKGAGQWEGRMQRFRDKNALNAACSKTWPGRPAEQDGGGRAISGIDRQRVTHRRRAMLHAWQRNCRNKCAYQVRALLGPRQAMRSWRWRRGL